MSNTEQRAFTPGPWHVDAHLNVMATGGLVAFPGIAAGFDQAANARLIAAAPDLYACVAGFRRKLETYLHVYTGDKELRRLLADCDAALTRATTS